MEDSVPKDRRKFIVDDQGSPIPLGILNSAWPSAELMAEMVKLLIEERLGFHAEIQPQKGSYGASPIWALAGCLDFDGSDKRCGEAETKFHIAVDSWIGSYQPEFDAMREEHPTIAPVDLGGMGYLGEESVCVTDGVFMDGYNDIGLALDFYRSYNTSYHDPKKYFDSIHDVPVSELHPCNTTHMADPQRIGDYYRYSGDDAGVRRQPDGTYFAYCPDDLDNLWWIAPACRQNTSRCIPTITSSVGWRMQAMMQWSTAYGMPAAIGVISSFTEFTNRIPKVRALFYWWVPDSTFIDLRPLQIVFPRHSVSAWAIGDKTTSAAGSHIAKMVSSNLFVKASSVQAFVSQFQFELSQVQSLLSETKPWDQVSCDWVKNNKRIWEKWLPVETNCFPGFGIISADNAFVQSRSGGVSCGLCPAGRFSEEIADVDGKTYRCALCSPGSSQSKTFSTSCEECPPGTYSSDPGSEACRLCPIGEYQNSSGQSSCNQCGEHRSTFSPAASGIEQCVCLEGRIETDTSRCIPCMEGLSCPRGSTRAQLLVANDTDDQKSHLLPGYSSEANDPFMTYKCPSARFCPGGRPGSCSGSLSGPTCSECGENEYRQANECYTCTAGVKAGWVVLATLVCLCVIATHILSTNSYTNKATSLLCITTGVGMLVVLLQNLGVMHSINVAWPAGLSDILRFAALFLLSLQGLGLSCFTGGSVVWEYASVTFVFWFLAVALPAISSITQQIPYLVRRQKAWNTMKTFSTVGQFLQVGFTTMTSLSLTPFMCQEHPSGKESILKYPSVFCHSAQHISMQVFGACLAALVASFFVFCIFAAIKAPQWAFTSKLTAIRFLVVRFRPDVWWFGLVLLFRGLLLSLPAVVVTDLPSIHLVSMLFVLLVSLCLQTFFLPWKAPVLNLVDALSNGCFVALLSVALAFLEVDSEGAANLMQLSAVLLSIAMVLILVFMILLTLSGFVYSKGFGSTKDSILYNLGTLPEGEQILRILLDIAEFLQEEIQNGKQDTLVKNLETFSFYDLDAVVRALNILADDCEMVIGMETPSGNRINSGQRTVRETTKGSVYVHRLSTQSAFARSSQNTVSRTSMRNSVARSMRMRASLASQRAANQQSSLAVPETNFMPEVPEAKEDLKLDMKEAKEETQEETREEKNRKPRWQL